MNRGEAWWAEFTPGVGGEIQKRRPVVIVSNDAANRHLNRVQVVPLTSNVAHLYPSEAYVTIGRRQNKAMADQITTVSKHRLEKRIGMVSDQDMEAIGNAILTQLALN